MLIIYIGSVGIYLITKATKRRRLEKEVRGKAEWGRNVRQGGAARPWLREAVVPARARTKARGRSLSGAREATRDITPLLRIGSPDPNLPYGCGVSIVEEFNKVLRVADVCGRLPSIMRLIIARPFDKVL